MPLTKPPLAAWALRKVLEADPAEHWDGADWVEKHLATLRNSQDWWFAASDLDGDGMPEYGHPYSSGLDDSPIFDGPLPTTAPDLGAYLVLQDLELAGFAERRCRGGSQELAQNTATGPPAPWSCCFRCGTKRPVSSTPAPPGNRCPATRWSA